MYHKSIAKFDVERTCTIIVQYNLSVDKSEDRNIVTLYIVLDLLVDFTVVSGL